MHNLGLAEQLHYCAIGAERVFLDLAADRYFSLPAKAGDAFRALEEGVAMGPDDAGVALLVREGILVDHDRGKPILATRNYPPTESLVETIGVRANISLRAMAEALCLVAFARHGVRAKRLPRLLARLSHRAPRRAALKCERDLAVARFCRVRPLVPIRPNCLYDSIALTRFLHRRGIAATLAIGVKLHPFAAHAWVQDGATVLNDSLGHARDFQPVLFI